MHAIPLGFHSKFIAIRLELAMNRTSQSRARLNTETVESLLFHMQLNAKWIVLVRSEHAYCGQQY